MISTRLFSPNERVVKGIGIELDYDLFISDEKGNRWTFNPAVMAEGDISSTKYTRFRTPAFVKGCLMQITGDWNEHCGWQKENGANAKEVALRIGDDVHGKIASIKKCKRFGPSVISVFGYDRKIELHKLSFLNPDYIARLFKQHFEAYTPGVRHEKIVKAVQTGDTRNMYEHLQTAYREAN